MPFLWLCSGVAAWLDLLVAQLELADLMKEHLVLQLVQAILPTSMAQDQTFHAHRPRSVNGMRCGEPKEVLTSFPGAL